MVTSCPGCKADLPDESEKTCPFCEGRLAAPGDRLVPVMVTSNISQAQYIKALLEGSQVQAWIQNEHTHATWGGIDFWEWKGGVYVVVPREEEERAREVLCLRGVVCKIAPGEVDGLLEGHVRPAMRAGSGGAKGLVPTLALNKKEVIREVVQTVAEEEGGLHFVETVLQEAISQGEDWLAARLAGSLDGLDAAEVVAIPSRLASVIDGEARRRGAAAIAQMSRHAAEATRILVSLLDDPEVKVREEAIEGLFSLVGEDLGFEPDDPPEERARVIQRWRERIS